MTFTDGGNRIDGERSPKEQGDGEKEAERTWKREDGETRGVGYRSVYGLRRRGKEGGTREKRWI